jgi:arabinogalactan endo-1,4-beta-galactosidase
MGTAQILHPFYDSTASLSALKVSLGQLASTYGKEIAVAVTNWPVSFPKPKCKFPSDTTSIPFSAAGQTTWIQNITGVVAGTSGGIGVSIGSQRFWATELWDRAVLIT